MKFIVGIAVGFLGSTTQATEELLFRLNPDDGHTSFEFTSPVWTSKGVGFHEKLSDELKDEVASSFPISYIKLQSENKRTKQVATRIYKMTNDFRGKPFFEIMRTAYRQEITEAPYFEAIPASSFDKDPIMSVSGGLRANVQAGPSAVRLSSTGEGLPEEDLEKTAILQGLGVDYFLSESASDFIEPTSFSASALNFLNPGMGADMTGVNKAYSVTGADHEQRSNYELNEAFVEQLDDVYIYHAFVADQEIEINPVDTVLECGHHIDCINQKVAELSQGWEDEQVNLQKQLAQLQHDNFSLKSSDTLDTHSLKLTKESKKRATADFKEEKDQCQATVDKAAEPLPTYLEHRWCIDNPAYSWTKIAILAFKKNESLFDMTVCQAWGKPWILLIPFNPMSDFK